VSIMVNINLSHRPKISPEFATRLMTLEPRQKIRIIVLLQIPKTESNKTVKPQTRAERQNTIQSVRNSASQALANITNILQKFEGKTLTEQPDLLGSIPIEITAPGVTALAQSNAVKTIIEDQPIHPAYTQDFQKVILDYS
ncbi:MAG: hypothetical protein VKL42_18485, partial [Snowella sp.]|nr:hypothetical protein [Snowella sp.]